jgi:hypothetical protein
MMEYHVEALLAGGYAILLVLIAALLEWLARQSQKRSDQYDTAGFRFHRDRDAWECPQGARLERAEINHALRIIQYRAPAHTCNGCSIKAHCTNSERGRTISMPLDPLGGYGGVSLPAGNFTGTPYSGGPDRGHRITPSRAWSGRLDARGSLMDRQHIRPNPRWAVARSQRWSTREIAGQRCHDVFHRLMPSISALHPAGPVMAE